MITVRSLHVEQYHPISVFLAGLHSVLSAPEKRWEYQVSSSSRVFAAVAASVFCLSAWIEMDRCMHEDLWLRLRVERIYRQVMFDAAGVMLEVRIDRTGTDVDVVVADIVAVAAGVVAADKGGVEEESLSPGYCLIDSSVPLFSHHLPSKLRNQGWPRARRDGAPAVQPLEWRQLHSHKMVGCCSRSVPVMQGMRWPTLLLPC
jgi:hypothetical protein